MRRTRACPGDGAAESTGKTCGARAQVRKGWQPRQPHPGTRITHYRCFLPDLAGFASYRREGTDEATMSQWRMRRL